ncbi:MAG TPA: hypothetical protein EYP36_10675 [Calditrichaeota bacterium]|nr:hypothetical protein [Calditrichota bacterium]
MHNLSAQLLSEIGTFGALALLILLFTFYFTQKRTVALIRDTHKPSDFLAHISMASVDVMWLLLVQGLAGHNLYRYTWLWIAAVLALAEFFARIEHEKQLSSGNNKSLL